MGRNALRSQCLRGRPLERVGTCLRSGRCAFLLRKFLATHPTHGCRSLANMRNKTRGFSKGRFRRVQCHHQEDSKWPMICTQQYMWHSERHNRKRRKFLQKPRFKNLLFAPDHASTGPFLPMRWNRPLFTDEVGPLLRLAPFTASQLNEAEPMGVMKSAPTLRPELMAIASQACELVTCRISGSHT